MHPVADAEKTQDFLEPGILSVRIAGDVARDVDVALGTQRRQQIVFLKHKADGLLTQIRAFLVAHPQQIAAVDVPDPLGPTTERNSPLATVRFTPRSACTSTSP